MNISENVSRAILSAVENVDSEIAMDVIPSITRDKIFHASRNLAENRFSRVNRDKILDTTFRVVFDTTWDATRNTTESAILEITLK